MRCLVNQNRLNKVGGLCHARGAHRQLISFSASNENKAVPGLRLRGRLFVMLLFSLNVPAFAEERPNRISEPTSLTPMVFIAAGEFIMGSTAEEREYGYRLDESRGSKAARHYRWFENETRQQVYVNAFHIDKYLTTNSDYQRFVVSRVYPTPYVDRQTWDAYGLVHAYDAVQRFLWRNGGYPKRRGDHPVVLVAYRDAVAYCQWRGQQEHRRLRLPTEPEWEKAARGVNGAIFPWGNAFDAKKLNSADAGPYDTLPVGQFNPGVSPYGLHDMAGMVFEWTTTACPTEQDKMIVKGGSWDDYPGVTRSAARHCRPRSLQHILIGFRCAADA